MRGKVLICAFVVSLAVVSAVGSGSMVKAQAEKANQRAFERSAAVGASISHPEEWRFDRDEHTYDGSYGYTLWKPETKDPHDHGGKPAVRIARDAELKPGQIDESVEQTLQQYPDELGLSREKVRVGNKGPAGVAVGPIPGATPYIEVYVPHKGEVYRIDLYTDELDAEARELLESVRFDEPGRSIASLDLPEANSEEALYPEGGPESETLQREEVVEETSEEPSTNTYSASSYSASSTSVPRYGEKRIYEGCYRAYSRFWLQTQHDAFANANRYDGIPTGYTVIGSPNYWGQYSHGNLGYGRCNSDYYTNDKFAVDYPYNHGDRLYSPFRGGEVVFAGRTRSHRAYGIFVVIRSPTDKYVGLSAHLSGLAPGITEGATVDRNTVIGYAGKSGGTDEVPVGPVHLHQAFYRHPSFRPNGAPYGGQSLQTLYYHYAGTAAGDGGGIYKFGWQSTSYQKAEGDRISN